MPNRIEENEFVNLDEMMRRIEDAFPQSVVETRLGTDGMIAVVIDGQPTHRLYPDTDYLEDCIERTIQDIKRKVAPAAHAHKVNTE